MKVIILDIGHSEWPKEDNPLETSIAREIAQQFCDDLHLLILEGKVKDIVGIKVPETVTGKDWADALMNKIYWANAVVERDKNPKIYVSLHCNWSNDNLKAKGWNIFFKDLNKVKQSNLELAQQGKRLADIIGGRLESGSFPFWGAEGVKPDSASGPGSLAVCTYTKCPACLIELGFLSNDNDRQLLQESSYREKMISAIWGGMQIYFS